MLDEIFQILPIEIYLRQKQCCSSHDSLYVAGHGGVLSGEVFQSEDRERLWWIHGTAPQRTLTHDTDQFMWFHDTWPTVLTHSFIQRFLVINLALYTMNIVEKLFFYFKSLWTKAPANCINVNKKFVLKQCLWISLVTHMWNLTNELESYEKIVQKW